MTTNNTTAEQIEELLMIISDAGNELMMNGYYTLAELHSIILPADEAREKLNQISPEDIVHAQYELDYLYTEWESVTGIEFTATALAEIEKDPEVAKAAARNILGANRNPKDSANKLGLTDTLRQLREIGAKCYWRPEPNAHGSYLSHSRTFDYDRVTEFYNDGAIDWRWNPGDLYTDLPNEWIELYRDDRDRLVVNRCRLDDPFSTVSYDEDGNELKHENFRELEKDCHASNYTPLAFIYRRADDEIGKYRATLRILPLTRNIR